MANGVVTDEPLVSGLQIKDDSIGPTRSMYEESGKLPIGKVVFVVIGDYYKAHEVPGPYICSSHSRAPFIPIDIELQNEFDLWESASDEDLLSFEDSLE